MLWSLLFSAIIIIGCMKYERNAFADAIQIDSSMRDRHHYHQMIQLPMTMTLLKMRMFLLLGFYGDKEILLITLMNMNILVQNMKLQMF